MKRQRQIVDDDGTSAAATAPPKGRKVPKRPFEPSSSDATQTRNEEEEEEPFPLLDLPTELLFKIIKEYVPVTDKAGALSRVSQFAPYLVHDGLWFQSTLRLFRLAGILRPGWYADRRHRYSRYHVAVDYQDLTFSLHQYNLRNISTPISGNTETVPTSFATMQTMLRKLPERLRFQATDTEDVSQYALRLRRSSDFCRFLVSVPEKTVCWTSFDHNPHRLIDGKCLFRSNGQGRALSLTLREDRTIVLQLIDESTEAPRVFPPVTLVPHSFLICKVNHATHHEFPLKCTCYGSSVHTVYPFLENAIHARYVMTFKNCHTEDSAIEIETFSNFYADSFLTNL